MKIKNPILCTDSYKTSHFNLYRPGVKNMTSYIEARKGDGVLFNGLQYYLKEYLGRTITVDDVNQAKLICEAHGVPFPYDGWMKIATHYQGLPPLTIRAVREGTFVPAKNILMDVTLSVDDPDIFWLVSWWETLLLKIWYPCTVGTKSFNTLKIIKQYLEKTSDDVEEQLYFKLHDFGGRANSSEESAGISGFAHLINSMGTDTIEGIIHGINYYGAGVEGLSIPATEHSTITSWGRDGELDAYRNVLNQYAKPGALVACVSDSYDYHNAVDNLWGKELRQQIIDSGAILVVRPDSGEPVDVVTYALKSFAESFGYTVNSKGYKVLNNVRVIQGDGINPDTIAEILEAITELGFATDNVAFGMGGKLVQSEIDRDTFGFAMKCSAVDTEEGTIEVYKDPITDPGKKSKRGKLDLIKDATGQYMTINTLEYGKPYTSELVKVFENGEVLVEYTLAELRERAKNN